jgi:cell shape-determining protein MreC
LKVGEIVQVESGSATTPHKISIKPSAGIDSMQEVGILLYEPEAKEEFEQKINKTAKPRQ